MVSGQKISENDIHCFEVIFRQIDSKFLSDIRVDSSSTYLSENKKEKTLFNKQINNFPLTTDSEVIGKQIKDVVVKDNIVTSIPVKAGEETFDLMKSVNEQNEILGKVKKDPIVFDENYKFYVRDESKSVKILAVK